MLAKPSLTTGRYGNLLMELYNDYHSAETKVSELTLKFKAIWYKSETQMKFLQNIWHTLDSNFQRNQHLLLSILEIKLQEAVRLLNGIIGTASEPGGLGRILVKKGSLRKSDYVLRVKDSLERTLSEFIAWHNLFDPSWYLLARIPSDEIDRNLQSHSKDKAVTMLTGLRKSVRDLNSETNMPSHPISSNDFLGPRTPITASCAATAQFEGNIRYAIVDTMLVNSSMDVEGTTRSAIALTKALSRMDPFTFGLLRCCGVINKMDKYEFVFEIPQGLQAPQSLRDLLANIQPSLNVKLDIAKQLANSVFYLHTTGFVHKNIRPETILVFDHGEAKSSFLVGFENFRPTEEGSRAIGDRVPERELYRHPSRQGYNPEQKYIMQHDIYSLGVCLLEIGLWKSFIKVDEDGTVPGFDLEVFANDWRQQAYAIKKQLLITTDEHLSQHTGRRFKNIVEKCLTCLDYDTTWCRVDNKGASEVDVGVEFIENVLLQLQEIVV